MRLSFLLIMPLILSGATAFAAATNPSGLPLPRFVSLKADETNVRTGPGTRYPIRWVFKREDFPVEVVDEYSLWRKIRDHEQAEGWVHHSLLSGRRYAMILGTEALTLYIDSDEDSKALFKAAPGVIAPIRECEPEWCRLQISGRKGWIRKKYLWGIYPEEIFD